MTVGCHLCQPPCRSHLTRRWEVDAKMPKRPINKCDRHATLKRYCRYSSASTPMQSGSSFLISHRCMAHTLNVKEMNVKPGGKQRKMHDTLISNDNPNPALHGKLRHMVFLTDLAPEDPNYQYRGRPKDMRRFLEEWGLISMFTAENGGKPPVGECQFCKASRETQECLLREAQAVAAGDEEPDGTAEDVVQPGISRRCCMRKALASQRDFRAEKPLLQIVIKQARHKCYFIPKFHCELNPIEMHWGGTKIRELPISHCTSNN
jgi:hypothetical protein